MRLNRLTAVVALCALLSACGGGASDPGSNPFGTGSGSTAGGTTGSGTGTGSGSGSNAGGTSQTPTTGLAMTISLSSNVVTIAEPATVTVRLANRNGPVVGAVVSFTTTNDLGRFTPSAGTALTDATGTAVVTVGPRAADASGAAEITATAAVSGETVRAVTGFQFTASNVAIASFTTGLGVATLQAYGQTVPTVTISGTAPGTPVTVSLTSGCIASGKARVSPAQLTTTTGTASFAYLDNGCGALQATDNLTASIVNSPATSQASIPVAAPAASSLSFVSAAPSTIFLRGSSLAEQSNVTFEVRDAAGNPLPNRQVTLELTTFAGGLTIEGGTVPVVRTSDAQGRVTALVNSGTVPTPVRVRAALAGGGTSIATVSNELTVAVGLPSQVNFSLAQQTINIEGYDYIDTPNTYTVIASDRVGNPVPAGTAINFSTEGGQVQASRTIALTTAGIARADAAFVSALPRPADGRITVIAYALGEESFKDLNGNNVFDAVEPFQDLGDVFRNRLYDGIFDPANDEFISLQLPGAVLRAPCVNTNDPVLRLDVSVPSRQTDASGGPTCDGRWGQAYVRRAIETVLSTSSARPIWVASSQGTASVPGTVQLQTGPTSASRTTFGLLNGTTITGAGLRGSFTFLPADANPVRLNPVAAGSTVTFSSTSGLTLTLVAGSPVASTADAFSVPVGIQYEFDPTTTAGTATIRITSPRGLTTAFGVNIVR
jgi:hypothetical protein